jgi:hypothetical protein
MLNAQRVVGASIEGKKIEPVPEMSNFQSWASGPADE